MAEFQSPGHKQSKVDLFIFAFLCLLISFVLIWLYITGVAPVKKGELADTDCYMRLIRVSDLYNVGCWYNPIFFRSNAPYGESSHWTRPSDVLLLLGAAPLSLVIGFESALFWWAVIISPVLFGLTIIALHWTTKTILSRDGPFLILFVFALQPIILIYYQAGRPDHHSLILSFFVVSIGLTLRIIQKPFNMQMCYIAGAISALSIWISVESMLPTCITLVVLGVFWFLDDSDFLKKCLHYSLSLFITICISLSFERPWYDLVTVEYDRLSFFQCFLLGLVALFWVVCSILSHYTNLLRRRTNRFSFSMGGLLIFAFIVLVLFPRFYKGPFANIDPRIIPIWLAKINEVQPLLSRSVSLTLSVPVVGTFVVGLLFLVYLLLQSNDFTNRKAWIYILISIVILFLASLYQIRWSGYAQILSVIVVTELMSRILSLIGTRESVLCRALIKSFVVLTFSVIFLIIGMLANIFIKGSGAELKGKDVSLIRICAYLAESERPSKQNLRILTHIDFTPEILYRTRCEVIGTPYHRNGEGITDTYDIMTAESDREAFQIIQKRRINFILLCPKSSESSFYSKPKQKSTFYKRLLENVLPDWLRKVELPSNLSHSFILFEIINE